LILPKADGITERYDRVHHHNICLLELVSLLFHLLLISILCSELFKAFTMEMSTPVVFALLLDMVLDSRGMISIVQ
jgi:hypothetical protein